MKHKLFLLLLFSGQLFSQDKLEFGVKVGANLSGFHTKNGASTSYGGIHFGAIAKYKFNKIVGVQTELLYNSKGGTYEINGSYGPNVKLKYIDVPINTNIYITKKFTLDLGFSYGFLISKKAEYNGQKMDIENIKNTDFNVLGGLSYKFDKGIYLQTRYGYGLTKLFDNKDYYNSCISLSLGYFIK